MSFGRLRNRRSERGVNRSSRIGEVLLQLLDVLERADDAAGADVLIDLALAALPFGRPEPRLSSVNELLGDHNDLAAALLDLDEIALLEAKGVAYGLGDGHLVVSGNADDWHVILLYSYITTARDDVRGARFSARRWSSLRMTEGAREADKRAGEWRNR